MFIVHGPVLVTGILHTLRSTTALEQSPACLISDACGTLSLTCHLAIFATAVCLVYEIVSTLLLLTFYYLLSFP